MRVRSLLMRDPPMTERQERYLLLLIKQAGKAAYLDAKARLRITATIERLTLIEASQLIGELVEHVDIMSTN